jgi:hypothetical protein
MPKEYNKKEQIQKTVADLAKFPEMNPGPVLRIGIFAVGDVRSGANRRVAAAVGEGSASIYMVHQYLQTV